MSFILYLVSTFCVFIHDFFQDIEPDSYTGDVESNEAQQLQKVVAQFHELEILTTPKTTPTTKISNFKIPSNFQSISSLNPDIIVHETRPAVAQRRPQSPTEFPYSILPTRREGQAVQQSCFLKVPNRPLVVPNTSLIVPNTSQQVLIVPNTYQIVRKSSVKVSNSSRQFPIVPIVTSG